MTWPQGIERRGLTTIIAVAVPTIVLGAVSIGFLVNGLNVPGELLTALGGIATGMFAMGTKGIAQRSASTNARNEAAKEYKEAAEQARIILAEAKKITPPDEPVKP